MGGVGAGGADESQQIGVQTRSHGLQSIICRPNPQPAMKTLVLGAGVIGTSTAWYLAQSGHEVEVLDRREGAGLETSFANGGQISVCHAEPW
ncbi:MAG: FAD-dependent oxidoreductase, partial [Usitatibacter sp.]